MSDWTELESETFIDGAHLFVPSRDELHETIVRAMDLGDRRAFVIELSCGDGELARRVLMRHGATHYLGLDRSERMREHAKERLSLFGARAMVESFDIHNFADMSLPSRPDALISSLAVHHLDGEGKKRLFRKAFAELEVGGRLVICDVVLPAGAVATAIAAQQWNCAVARNSLDAFGDLRGLERFHELEWNMYSGTPVGDEIDKPSTLLEQLNWVQESGFKDVDVIWHYAGHAVFCATKR
ncbi:class I SAM-dependent methyltransferase [Verminephrobacter aporrectodeae subsp. tuberculatae]|uniref:class I SAM-dependent methyltransferase n=1 Tax=Verminephrobacter aporrectodeae TaxID=1110389 RepID=UPI0022441C1F|nr:class I SAM-dependent methyltransferase [Verminephrobacter aporrectodeae]MCW8198755.1 class I SAM-dependent methyltransferase [Verminephrobacter aporrectodeae subsp. tuberculatae]